MKLTGLASRFFVTQRRCRRPGKLSFSFGPLLNEIVMAKKTPDDFLAAAKQMCGFLSSEKDDMEWEDFSAFCAREILSPLAKALKIDPGFAKARLLKAKVL